jgi:DNA invertase Pin-like site-specific DNA recombinase
VATILYARVSTVEQTIEHQLAHAKGREQLAKVQNMFGQYGVAAIARETGLKRQTLYRIKDDPAGAEAALVAWGL